MVTISTFTGSLTLDQHSERQLHAFLRHHKPEIISPATETEAGPMWLAIIGNATVAGVTATTKTITHPLGVLTAGLATELFPETRRIGILHIRPTFSRLVPINHIDLLLREYEALQEHRAR